MPLVAIILGGPFLAMAILGLLPPLRRSGRPAAYFSIAAIGAGLVASILLFLLCYLGLAISIFPIIAPPDLTIWDAAAVPESQIFTLIGVLVMLPIILAYTAFVYWTFLRDGKVVPGEGYH